MLRLLTLAVATALAAGCSAGSDTQVRTGGSPESVTTLAAVSDDSIARPEPVLQGATDELLLVALLREQDLPAGLRFDSLEPASFACIGDLERLNDTGVFASITNDQEVDLGQIHIRISAPDLAAAVADFQAKCLLPELDDELGVIDQRVDGSLIITTIDDRNFADVTIGIVYAFDGDVLTMAIYSGVNIVQGKAEAEAAEIAVAASNRLRLIRSTGYEPDEVPVPNQGDIAVPEPVPATLAPPTTAGG